MRAQVNGPLPLTWETETAFPVPRSSLVGSALPVPRSSLVGPGFHRHPGNEPEGGKVLLCVHSPPPPMLTFHIIFFFRKIPKRQDLGYFNHKETLNFLLGKFIYPFQISCSVYLYNVYIEIYMYVYQNIMCNSQIQFLYVCETVCNLKRKCMQQ